MALEVCIVDPHGRLTAPLGVARYGGNLAVFQAELNLGGLAPRSRLVDIWVLPGPPPESLTERCRLIFVGEGDAVADGIPAEKLVRVREGLTKEHLVAEIERQLCPPCDVAVDLGALGAPFSGSASTCAGLEARRPKVSIRSSSRLSALEKLTLLITNCVYFIVCSGSQ